MLAIVLLFLFLRTLYSHPVPSPVHLDTLTAHIDEAAEKVLRCSRLPGLSIAVVRAPKTPNGQEQVVTKAYGFADIASQRSALPTTRFCVAGLTQAFTAAVLTQLLHENESYSLDTPLEKILGSSFQLIDPELSRKVTTRDILSHQVGIAPYFGGFVLGYNMTRTELVRRLRYIPVISEFRQSFVPSPLLYVLAGQLVQVLNDTSWENVITRRIFKPLRMTGSTFADRVPNWSADFALAHVLKDGQHVPLLSKITGNILRPVGPSGSICSTSADMSKWMLMLLQNGTLNQPVLHPEVVQEMFTSQNIHFPKSERKGQGKLPVDAETDAYNLGWISGTYKNRRRYFQNAFSNYYGAFITLLPDEGIGIFTAANGPSLPLMDSSFRVLHYYIMDIVLGEEPWLDLKSTACLFPHLWFETPNNESEPSTNSVTKRTPSMSKKPKITVSTPILEDLSNDFVSLSSNSAFNLISTSTEVTEEVISERTLSSSNSGLLRSTLSPELEQQGTTPSFQNQNSTYPNEDDDNDYDAFLQSTPFEIYKIQNFTKPQNLNNTSFSSSSSSPSSSSTTTTTTTSTAAVSATTPYRRTTQRTKSKFRFKSTKTTPITSSTTPMYTDLSSIIMKNTEELKSTSTTLKQTIIPLINTNQSLETTDATNIFQNFINSSSVNQTGGTSFASAVTTSANTEILISTNNDYKPTTGQNVKNNFRVNHRFSRPHFNKNITNFKSRLFKTTEHMSVSTVGSTTNKDFTKGFLVSSPKQENVRPKTKRIKVLRKQNTTLQSNPFGLRIHPTSKSVTPSLSEINTLPTEPKDFLEELIGFFPSPIDLTDPKTTASSPSSVSFSSTNILETTKGQNSNDEGTEKSNVTFPEQEDTNVSETDLEEFIILTAKNTDSFNTRSEMTSSILQTDKNNIQQKTAINQNVTTPMTILNSESVPFINSTSSMDKITNHLLNFSSLISKHTAKLDVKIMNAVDSGIDHISSPMAEPKIITETPNFRAKNMTILDQYIQELITNISLSENPVSLLQDIMETTAFSKPQTKSYELNLNTIKVTNPIFIKSSQTTATSLKTPTTSLQTKKNNGLLQSSTEMSTLNLNSTSLSTHVSDDFTSPSFDEPLEELDISSHFKNLGLLTSVSKQPKVATILASLPVINVLASTMNPGLLLPTETSNLPPPVSRNTISNIFFERGFETTPIAPRRSSAFTIGSSPIIPVRKFPIPSRRRLSSRVRGIKTASPIANRSISSTSSQDEITDILLHLSSQLFSNNANRQKRQTKSINPYPENVGTYSHQFFGNIVIFFNRTSGTLQMEYGFYGKAHLVPEKGPNTFRMRFFSAIWYASSADDTKHWPQRLFLVHFKRPAANKPPNKLMIPLFEPQKPPMFLRNDNS